MFTTILIGWITTRRTQQLPAEAMVGCGRDGLSKNYHTKTRMDARAIDCYSDRYTEATSEHNVLSDAFEEPRCS